LATEALATSRSLPRPINKSVERAFFAGMAILLSMVVVIGFARTYFFAGMVSAPLPNLLVHVHGAAFTLWMILYLVQSALISAKRVGWHRSLGTIAFCLPPLMVILGMLAAIDGIRRGTHIGPLSTATSSAIPLIGMIVFGTVIAAAWRTRRQPASHKRYVVYATISLTEAAFGRFPWKSWGMTPAAGAVTGLAILILLMLAYDLFSLHRIHKSSAWAAPFTFVFGAFAVPIGMTPVWVAFAGFLAKYIAPHV
jgi:hypothetical protein